MTEDTPSPSTDMTSPRRIALNSVLNMLTGVVIIGLNLAFVPALIRAFGTELFSVLSITWMVLANLAWLDLGFSRAAALFVAQELAIGRPDHAAVWSWTAVLTQVVIGSVGALVLYLVAPSLTILLHIDGERRALVTLALRLFAFAVPIDLATRSLSGVLQARQRFGVINLINLAVTFGTFGVYGFGVYSHGNFGVVIFGLFILRVANLAATAAAAVHALPALRRPPDIATLLRDYRSRAGTMVRFGWWVSVAALLGALLLYFDQWMIGFVVGASALPFYSIPVSILGRLGFLTSSVTTTLFPAFSALHVDRDWARIERLFFRAHRYVTLLICPMLFVLFAWGYEALRLWIGVSFAQAAVLPLHILAFGMAIALLAPITGALLEAMGRPQVLAKLYAVELPFNLALVYLLTHRFGIVGAAWSFSIRALAETLSLWVIIYRIAPVRAPLRSGYGLLLLVGSSVACGLLVRNASTTSAADLAVSTLFLIAYAAVVLLIFVRHERSELFQRIAVKLRWKR